MSFSSKIILGQVYRTKVFEVEGKTVVMEMSEKIEVNPIVGSLEYLKDYKGVFVMYDLTDRGSFEEAVYLLKRISRFIHNQEIILLASMYDLSAENRAVTYREGKRLATEYEIEFFEISAKDDINVYAAFYTMASEIIERLECKKEEKWMEIIMRGKSTLQNTSSTSHKESNGS